jgi:tetratricopeptide (TPR) repeat protein
MKLFGIFGGGDPAAALARAEDRLARGNPPRAIELARPLLSDPTHREAASALIARARAAMLASCLERAAEAEEAGLYGDAADWLTSALDHAGDAERGEIEARRDALAGRPDRTGSGEPGAGEPVPEVWDDDDEPPEPYDEYETLVQTLRPEIAARYGDRPERFRRALVDLNSGDAAAASVVLEGLAEESPDDPVYRLERGRCRLFAGDAAGARADLEAAREGLGDEPLDLAGGLSPLRLWAEALLDAGEPGPILDQLREAAHPDQGDPELSKLFGRALLDAGRLDHARQFLAEAASWYSSDLDFAHLLGATLARLGERRPAIECLETALARACSGGACAKPAPHPPAMRLLASLYLEDDPRPGDPGLERAGELLAELARARGALAPAELRLLALYHEAAGHPEAARRALPQAAKLDAGGKPAAEPATPSPAPDAAAGRPPI